MWLLCDRGATPSDRGQWGSALLATPVLSMVKNASGGPENNRCYSYARDLQVLTPRLHVVT
jgi:hypothetical protein